MIDKQAALDLAWKQSEIGPGYDENGGCCLRTDNGSSKCFVGALIKDEAYQQALEGEQRTSDKFAKAMTDSGWDYVPWDKGQTADFLFIHGLQKAHDLATTEQLWTDKLDVPRWRESAQKNLRRLAGEHGLKCPSSTA
jgi:hypothetical protein